MALLVMVDFIPIDLMDVVAPKVLQVVVMVALQMIHTQQLDQFKRSMIAIKNTCIDLLRYQQMTQNDTTCVFQVIHQSQRDHANDS